MKSARSILLPLAAALLLTALPTHGQAQRASLDNGQPKLRFLFLDDEATAYTLETGSGGRSSGRNRLLSAEPYLISDPVRVTPGGELRLVRTDQNKHGTPASRPDATPQTADHNSGTDEAQAQDTNRVSRVRAPSTDSLLVFSPSDAKSAARPPLIYPDDPASFPAGSIRIINLGIAPMAAAFGTERLLLNPGESRIIHPELDARGRTRTRVGIQKQSSDGQGNWEMIYNSITSIREGERVTGILVYSPSGLSFVYTDEQLEEMEPLPAGHFWLTSTDRIQLQTGR